MRLEPLFTVLTDSGPAGLAGGLLALAIGGASPGLARRAHRAGAGVPPKHEHLVADFLVEFFEEPTHPSMRVGAMEMLAQYGDASDLD